MTGDNGETSSSEEASIVPEVIQELSESCRQFVQRAVGVELDYSAETLPVLDQYLFIARQSFGERPELHPLVARSAGAYLGEVIRQRFGGFWRCPTADAHGWRICARRIHLSLNPVGIIEDALAGGLEHGGPSSEIVLDAEDRLRITRRLEQAPPLPEDEFYLTSSRVEMLDIVFETLLAYAQAGGADEPYYEEEDYD